eukprot:3435527-Rhodomonas_salina.3
MQTAPVSRPAQARTETEERNSRKETEQEQRSEERVGGEERQKVRIVRKRKRAESEYMLIGTFVASDWCESGSTGDVSTGHCLASA